MNYQEFLSKIEEYPIIYLLPEEKKIIEATYSFLNLNFGISAINHHMKMKMTISVLKTILIQLNE